MIIIKNMLIYIFFQIHAISYMAYIFTIVIIMIRHVSICHSSPDPDSEVSHSMLYYSVLNNIRLVLEVSHAHFLKAALTKSVKS